MHTVVQPAASKKDGAAAKAVRVAVAGATGYTGQELLRLLSRHPGVTITAATLLALRPLLSAGLIAPGADIVVDAKSGVSGAGKTPSERTHFSEVHGSVAAYGVFGHRHGAEIEQGAGCQVNFVPHLMPLDRGLLSTIYLRLVPGTTEDTLASVYERSYD